MSLLVLGSVAIDSVKTPKGVADNVLGGSATYAALSASYFTSPSIVGVVGEDFKSDWISLLTQKGIDVSGIQIKNGKTFQWKGVYEEFNKAITLQTQLNVFKSFNPILTTEQRKSNFVFLGNIDPEIQGKTVSALECDARIGMDTMNYWINVKKQKLKDVIRRVDILFINEDEAKLLSETDNLFVALDNIQNFFNGIVVLKRGEYGSILYYHRNFFFCPAFPLTEITDTTGAGDTFAGAFMGYLSNQKETNFTPYKKALIYATVMASFGIEAFSVNNLLHIDFLQIEQRYNLLKEMITI